MLWAMMVLYGDFGLRRNITFLNGDFGLRRKP